MSDVKSLVERLHMAQIASCTCMTKSPDTTYHAEDCRYRVLEEAADLIEQQAARIAALESENRELSEFVIAVGGFWGNSKSKLVGEGSLAEVINRGLGESRDAEVLRTLIYRTHACDLKFTKTGGVSALSATFKSNIVPGQGMSECVRRYLDAFMADAAIAAKENTNV